MSFTPSIPQPEQSLGETVDEVRNNFLNYYNTMARNHVAPNKIGAGKHKFIQFIKQTPTSPTTGRNEVALYNKDNILYYRNQNNGAQFQISGNPANVSTGTTGFSTVLQDGNVVKFGSILGTVNVPCVINYATVCGSAFTFAPYSAKIQGQIAVVPTNFQNDWVITASTATDLTFLPTLIGVNTYYFLAIGE